LLRALNVSDLDPFIDLLNDQSDADGLRALFTTWITAPQPDLDVLVPAVIDGAIQYISSGATEFAAEVKTLLELGERYPGDAGVLAALLLNRVTLAPCEAIFLPAGNLHTYLRGFAVEVMANSDNVLRGGLTPKHVDVPELLRVLDFTAPPPPVRADAILSEPYWRTDNEVLRRTLRQLRKRAFVCRTACLRRASGSRGCHNGSIVRHRRSVRGGWIPRRGRVTFPIQSCAVPGRSRQWSRLEPGTFRQGRRRWFMRLEHGGREAQDGQCSRGWVAVG